MAAGALEPDWVENSSGIRPREAAGRTRRPPNDGPLGPDLLGIYRSPGRLDCGEVEFGFVFRVAGAHRGTRISVLRARLTAEIVGDRATLRDMMAALGVPVRRYKAYGAWVGERGGAEAQRLPQGPLSAEHHSGAGRPAAGSGA